MRYGRWQTGLLVGLTLGACGTPPEPVVTATNTTASRQSFVGSEACRSCHVAQYDAWRTSQHANAMREATPSNVAGDFADASVEVEGTRYGFRREGDTFLIDAVDRNDVRRAFPVTHTFGVTPLEQYVVDYRDGARQIPTVAWDTDAKRWFSVHGDETIAVDDVLHWTGSYQNWNSQCAECHSTAVRKRLDAATGRYATTFSEVAVGCEACHGRGARHVASGDTRDLEIDFVEPHAWVMDAGQDIARRDPPLARHVQPDACGRCHARRTSQSDDYAFGRPLLDTHRPALLSAPLYHADGQIHDEVFEWGSFLQSRMYAAGVECSDCHEPHAGKLRATDDALCSTCHAPTRFAVVAHGHHQGVRCVDCHMPATTYMAIDARRDHAFPIPSPHATLRFGVPNACSSCHNAWPIERLADAIDGWYPNGRHRDDRSTLATTAFTSNDVAALLAVARDRTHAAIVRATAWQSLLGRSSAKVETVANAVAEALRDADPLVRFAAVQNTTTMPPEVAIQLAGPLLTDRVRNVRIEAARALAANEQSLPPALRDSFQRAAVELVRAETYNADRDFGNLNLGNFLLARGNVAAAERAYLTGLRVAPRSAELRVNMADAYRRRGDDEAALKLLEEARALAPTNAVVHEALALTFIRLGRRSDAIAALDRGIAAAEHPDRLRYLRVLTTEDSPP